MNNPINISPEAREAAAKETMCYGKGEQGHFVQLAINSAVAEKDKEIELWKQGCFANAEDARDAHQVSDNRRLENITITKQLAELREIAACLAVNGVFQTIKGHVAIDRYTQWKEKNQL